jgi:hypothetical protein
MPGSATAGASAVGDTAATGTAATVALSDHRHSREAFGTPGAVTGGATAASGSATTLARSDHVHSTASMPVLLASTTLSSAAASVVLSSIPQTYTRLSVVGQAITNYSSAAFEYLLFKFNSDTGSNYLNTSGTGTILYYAYAASNTNYSGLMPAVMLLDIFNYASTTYHKHMSGYSSTPVSSTATGSGFGTGAWKQAAAISTITISLEHGGNFQLGTWFQIYGYP